MSNLDAVFVDIDDFYQIFLPTWTLLIKSGL